MNDDVTQLKLDDKTRGKLARVRELLAETLPLLASVEQLLDVPEAERYVRPEWVNGSARSPNETRRGP